MILPVLETSTNKCQEEALSLPLHTKIWFRHKLANLSLLSAFFKPQEDQKCKRERKQRRFGNPKDDLGNLKQQSKNMQNQLRFRDQKNNKSHHSHTRPHPTLFHAPYPIRVAYLHLMGDVFGFDSESVMLVSES